MVYIYFVYTNILEFYFIHSFISPFLQGTQGSVHSSNPLLNSQQPCELGEAEGPFD